jgi:uncharacterized protein (TIGR00299 family) protein
MRTLAFDGRTGASGDMLLAALLATGADRAVLAPVEAALGVEYRVERVTKNGIRATAVDVLLADEGGRDGGGDGEHVEDARDDQADDEQGDEHPHHGDEHEQERGHDQEREHGREHDYGHDHEHGRGHDGDDDHVHAEGHGPTRTFPEVLEVVEGMELPPDVEADAEAIFRLLGEAEASVHGTDLEATHFHEVGADDAIADVVGVCLLLADLHVERIVTTPPATGGGEVTTSHGRYPVPTPAVVEIAERADWELRGGPVEAELLTPTGAAILAHLADGVASLPELHVEGSGYGAGGYGFPEHPNVLRAIVGEAAGGLVRDEIRVLETNLDDASPEVLGGLQETLTDAGARDVTVLSATMKKARPGHLVKVVVDPEDVQGVARRLAEETGTLGVRETGAGHRWIAERAFETATLEVDGESYEVPVKVARDEDGTVYDVSAEYEDAAAVAGATHLPAREVQRRAEAIVHDRIE